LLNVHAVSKDHAASLWTRSWICFVALQISAFLPNSTGFQRSMHKRHFLSDAEPSRRGVHSFAQSKHQRKCADNGRVCREHDYGEACWLERCSSGKVDCWHEAVSQTSSSCRHRGEYKSGTMRLTCSLTGSPADARSLPSCSVQCESSKHHYFVTRKWNHSLNDADNYK
jgi:hypothetical protein